MPESCIKKLSVCRFQARFCGTGLNMSDEGKVIEDGCHKDEGQEEYDVEACFCNDRDRCNSAHAYRSLIGALFVSLTLAAVVR